MNIQFLLLLFIIFNTTIKLQISKQILYQHQLHPNSNINQNIKKTQQIISNHIQIVNQLSNNSINYQQRQDNQIEINQSNKINNPSQFNKNYKENQQQITKINNISNQFNNYSNNTYNNLTFRILQENYIVVDFNYILNGLKVSFDGSFSHSVNGEQISSFTWDFGDSHNGAGQSIDHTFTQSGIYPITLKVVDNTGKINSVTKNINLSQSNRLPTVNFQIIELDGLTVELDASQSFDPEGVIVLYTWNFGDDMSESTKVPSINHTYAKEGNYIIELTIVDNQGATATQSLLVSVIVQANTSQIFYDPLPKMKMNANYLTVSFDASDSYSQNGILTKYKWQLGDGSIYQSKQFIHTFNFAGVYLVLLTVTDIKGRTSLISDTIIVKSEQQLQCEIDCMIRYLSVICYSSITNDDDVIRLDWSWGDGRYSSGSKNVNHNYEIGDSYRVQLLVTNKKRDIYKCSKQIQVRYHRNI